MPNYLMTNGKASAKTELRPPVSNLLFSPQFLQFIGITQRGIHKGRV